MMQTYEETNIDTKDKILVVTDSCEFGEELGSVLSVVDIDVFTTDTRDIYLKLLQDRPSVVIIDEDLAPDGWKISEDICKQFGIPIVVVGDSNPESAWVKVAEGKSDYFLNRPFGPLEFVARIRSLRRRFTRLNRVEAVAK